MFPYPITPHIHVPIPHSPTHPCSLTPFSHTSKLPYPTITYFRVSLPWPAALLSFPFHHPLPCFHPIPFPWPFLTLSSFLFPHPLPHSPVLYCVAAAVQYVFMWSLQRLAIVAHFVFTFCSVLQQSWIKKKNCSSVGVAFGVGGEEEGGKDAYWLNKCFMQNEFFFLCLIWFWLLYNFLIAFFFYFFFFFLLLLLLLLSSSSSSSSFSSLCFSLSPYALLASLYTVNDIIVSNMTCTVVLNFWLRLKCSPFAVLLFVPFTESFTAA